MTFSFVSHFQLVRLLLLDKAVDVTKPSPFYSAKPVMFTCRKIQHFALRVITVRIKKKGNSLNNIPAILEPSAMIQAPVSVARSTTCIQQQHMEETRLLSPFFVYEREK